MTDLATLGLAVDSREVVDASKDLDRIREAAARAERQADSFGKRVEDAGKRAAAANDNSARAADRAAKAYDGYSRAAQLAARAMGAIVGAAIGKALIDFADTWSDINARVGLAIRNMDASGAVLDRLATVARRTYSALDLTAESFVRNASVLRELGKSTAEQLDYTEALNLALVVSGARGEHAARVQDALGKAMAAGKLRGDELNTVIERGGRVAEILAEELGISQNQLRKLGSEGKITGDTIYNALTKRLEQLQEEAESMPATIGDGLMLIRNALFQTIGVFDQANGLSATFAEGLIAVADNIGRVVTYAATAVTAFGTYYVGAMVAAYVSTMTLNGALVLLRAALIRTGIGALIIGAGELVYQFGRLVSAAGGFGNAMGLLGDLASEVWERIKLDAHSAYLGVQAVWEKIKLGFLLGLSVMQKAWTDFLYFLADTAPTEGLSRTLTESAMKAGTEYLATERSIKGARKEIERLGAASDEAAAKARAPLESIAAIRKVMSDSSDASVDLDEKLKRVSSGFDGAGKAAKKAAQELQQFKDRADALAEQMFPGEYALREARELTELLDRFGGKLDDFQRKAVEHRIDLMFASSAAGVRDLSQETQKAGKEMEKAFQPVADLFADLFSKPVKDLDELVDKTMSAFAQIGQANLKLFTDQLFGTGAANDNMPEMAGMIGREVRKGAKAGTQEGSFEGLFTALGMSQTGAQAAGGAASAAIGGYGMGYQAQNPLMGAAGGALQGAMALGTAFPGIGHIAGAIIGGIAGAIGGILGKSKAKREARAELEKHRGAIESLLAVGEGTGVGSIASTLRDFYDEVAEAFALASKAGDIELGNRLQASWNKLFVRLATDFERMFDGQIEALHSGLGQSSPFLQGAQAVQELREELNGFVADVQYMGEQLIKHAGDMDPERLAAQVAEAQAAAQAMALSLLTGAKELSAVESEIARIDGTAAALQVSLQELGMSAEDAAMAIEQGVIVAMDKLRTVLVTDLNRSINDLSGFGFLNEIADAQSEFQTRMKDLAALGLDGSLAMQELGLRIREIATDASLTEDQLTRLASVFPDIGSALLGAIGVGGTDVALADAKAAVNRAQSDLRAAYEAEASARREGIEALEQSIKSIETFKGSLRFDDRLSPYGPQQQFMLAEAEFKRISEAALGGDKDAIGKVEDVSRQYLDASRDYYGTSIGYFEIFNEVERVLGQVLATGKSELSEAQQQLSALEAQIEAQFGTTNAVLSVADAMNNLAVAQATYNAALDDRFNAMMTLMQNQNQINQIGNQSQFSPEVTQLYQSVLGRAPDAAGAVGWQAGFDVGMSKDEIYKLFIRDVIGAGVSPNAALAKQYGFPGFADGGFHMGGLRMVGERGPELEATGPARIWSADQTRGMLANDNSAVVAELREVKRELAALRAERKQGDQVVAAGAQAQVAATGNVSAAVKDQTSEMKRAAGTRRA